MPPSPGEILEQRLRAEAERRGEPVGSVRDDLLRRGLDAARAAREARAVASDVVLVTAPPTEHKQLERAAKELGTGFDKLPGRYGPYYRLGFATTTPDRCVVREWIASPQVAQVPHEPPLDGAEPRLTRPGDRGPYAGRA